MPDTVLLLRSKDGTEKVVGMLGNDISVSTAEMMAIAELLADKTKYRILPFEDIDTWLEGLTKKKNKVRRSKCTDC